MGAIAAIIVVIGIVAVVVSLVGVVAVVDGVGVLDVGRDRVVGDGRGAVVVTGVVDECRTSGRRRAGSQGPDGDSDRCLRRECGK
jgi:hypothetical protein